MRSRLFALYRHTVFSVAVSPVCWVTSAAFSLYAALAFFVGRPFFSAAGSADIRPFFSSLPYGAILAVPAFCALAKGGAQDYALPFSSFSVVFARSCAVGTLCAFSLATALVVPCAVSWFGDVEAASLLCSATMMLLYLCSASAMCVAVWTLLPRAGFVLSAALLSVSQAAHEIPRLADLPPFFSALCRSVSFAWHFDAATKGIIDSRDVVFFALVCLSSLLLSSRIMEHRRGNCSSVLKKHTVLAAVTVLLVGANSTRFFVRLDCTESRRFSLSAYSRTLLSELEAPLEITYYRSAVLQELYPQVRDVEDYLMEYAAESPFASVSVHSPSDENTRRRLEQNGILPQHLAAQGADRISGSTVYAAITLSYRGRMEAIPFVLDASTLEYDLAMRVHPLVRGTVRTVQVVVANELSLEDDYSLVRPWLEANGLAVVESALPSRAEELRLLPFTALPSVPLLLVGTSKCTASDAAALMQFLQNGGRACIAASPYTVNVSGDWSAFLHDDAVLPLFSDYGLYVPGSMAADVSNFRLTMYSDTTALGASAAPRTEYLNYALWPELLPQAYAQNGMALCWPSVLELSDAETSAAFSFSLEPLLVTSRASWRVEPYDGTHFETNPFTMPRAAPPESREEIVVAARLSVDAGAAVVLSDQYAFSSQLLGYRSEGGAGDFRILDFLCDRLLSLSGAEALLPLKNKSMHSISLFKMPVEERIALRPAVLAFATGLPVTACLLMALGVAAYRATKRRVR